MEASSLLLQELSPLHTTLDLTQRIIIHMMTIIMFNDDNNKDTHDNCLIITVILIALLSLSSIESSPELLVEDQDDHSGRAFFD